MGTDIHGVFQRRTKEGKWEDVPSEYAQERHYLLFAWLGNVRNGFGFAGIPTHTVIVSLTDRRGLPKDFEVEDDEHNGEWMGDHSHSWVSADEVLDAKPPTVRRTGVVDRSFFESWDGSSAPSVWCGGISGQRVVVSDPSTVTERTTHVRIEWFEDTGESLKYFVDEVRRLKGLHGEVRFVFGFDS